MPTAEKSDKNDTPYIPVNNLIKPLREYQYSLKSDDIFGPFDLPSCKIFIKIISIKRGDIKKFTTVKREVEDILLGGKKEKEFKSWLESVKQAAVIEYIK